MLEIVGALWFLWFIFLFLPWFFVWRHVGKEPLATMTEEESRQGKRKYNPDDYWEEEEVDYATGEIITNTGPTIRHPKNRDRAYEGSVERFHDGGW